MCQIQADLRTLIIWQSICEQAFYLLSITGAVSLFKSFFLIAHETRTKTWWKNFLTQLLLYSVKGREHRNRCSYLYSCIVLVCSDWLKCEIPTAPQSRNGWSALFNSSSRANSLNTIHILKSPVKLLS